MSLTPALLSPIALAWAAPLLVKALPRAAAWVLALLPAALACFFAGRLEEAGAGRVPPESLEWVPALGVRFSLRLDGLSCLFALLITGIGAPITVFAGRYLEGHPRLGRFYASLFLFMGAMLGVVLSDNLFCLFVFWELTSVASYLLIGFDHERPAARTAALQALLVTGIGGVALLAGFVLLSSAVGSGELHELAARAGLLQGHPFAVPALLLVLAGAFTKSAQFPFHFWLPGAMEAPTPASAYLHAATMVKAGIYLLLRLAPVLGAIPLWTDLLLATGVVTMLLGAVMSLRETSFKGMLAYTTVGALGSLVMLIGVGTRAATEAALVVLLSHALYKGALFLVAGIVHHAIHRKEAEGLQGLGRSMRITGAAALLAALSMAGLPPFLGFVAKEGLYAAVLPSPILAAVSLLANALFIAAAVRVGILPFAGRPSDSSGGHEASPGFWTGPALLGALGAVMGLLPERTGRVLLDGALGAVVPGAAPVHLSLWHGLNLPLLLGVATLAGGVALVAGRKPLRAALDRASGLLRFGPAGAYAWGLRNLFRGAEGMTQLLQSGYLRTYVAFCLWTLVVLTGAALYAGGVWPGIAASSGLRIHEAVVLLLIPVAALFAAASPSRMAAVAGMGVVGYGVALVFFIFGAPDLAMTQFVVETLTVVLFILAFHHLPSFSPFSSRANRLKDVLLCGGVGALFALLVFAVLETPMVPHVSSYFAENTVSGGRGRNIVNVILVDFRALDTVGEITVLAVAAVGVAALLGTGGRKEGDRS